VKDQLIPRKNEIISEALRQFAVDLTSSGESPEEIRSFRKSLVVELKTVPEETEFDPFGSSAPSISG
jgi:hypothetical protein